MSPILSSLIPQLKIAAFVAAFVFIGLITAGVFPGAR